MCFYYSIAWNQGFSSISMLLLFVFWSSVEFSISKYCFVCFYHLLEGQANMFFLFVFTSFSRMEPTLSQQQVFLFRFLSFSITEPIFFKKWVLFVSLPFSRMVGSFFFVFLAFIRLLIKFSKIKMEAIFASSNAFLFYVFVI